MNPVLIAHFRQPDWQPENSLLAQCALKICGKVIGKVFIDNTMVLRPDDFNLMLDVATMTPQKFADRLQLGFTWRLSPQGDLFWDELRYTLMNTKYEPKHLGPFERLLLRKGTASLISRDDLDKEMMAK